MRDSGDLCTPGVFWYCRPCPTGMQLLMNVGVHWYAVTLFVLPHLSFSLSHLSLSPSFLSLSVSLSLSLSLSHAHTPHIQSPYQDGPQAANPSPQMLADSVEKVINDKRLYVNAHALNIGMHTCTCYLYM